MRRTAYGLLSYGESICEEPDMSKVEKKGHSSNI